MCVQEIHSRGRLLVDRGKSISPACRLVDYEARSYVIWEGRFGDWGAPGGLGVVRLLLLLLLLMPAHHTVVLGFPRLVLWLWTVSLMDRTQEQIGIRIWKRYLSTSCYDGLLDCSIVCLTVRLYVWLFDFSFDISIVRLNELSAG